MTPEESLDQTGIDNEGYQFKWLDFALEGTLSSELGPALKTIRRQERELKNKHMEEAKIADPLFKEHDIVFFKPVQIIGFEYDGLYPCIGTGREVDCKIYSVEDRRASGERPRYSLTTGRGDVHHEVREAWLVSSKDKHLFAVEGYKTAKIDTELYRAGTVFTKSGEYYSNDKLGIYIHVSRFDTIKQYFE